MFCLNIFSIIDRLKREIEEIQGGFDLLDELSRAPPLAWKILLTKSFIFN